MATRSFPEPREENDATFRIFDNGNPTRKVAFQASGVTAGNTRTITMPDADVDLGAATPASHGNTLHTTGVAPTTSAVADAAAEGSGAAVARADHLHGREAFAGPTTSAVGDTATSGTALTLARSDHLHGREAFGGPGISRQGDAAASGTATTIAKSDHIHARESFGTPSSSGVGDTIGGGVSTSDSRADHRHGREAFAGPSDVEATAASGTATTINKSDHQHRLGITTTRGDMIRRGATNNERFAVGASSQRLIARTDPTWEDDVVSINFSIDGGGATITTGIKGHVQIPYPMAFKDWGIFANQSGTIVVDVWKDSFSNFPLTVSDTVAGSAKPTLSGNQANRDQVLTNWGSKAVASGDILAFNVDSASNVQRVTVALHGVKA